MPHGSTLHLALKNSNHYYILWSHSTNLPASTTTGPSSKPALHIIIMPLQQALFHATSHASPAITDALLTTSFLLPSQLCASLLLWRRQYFLMHIKPPSDSDEDFITEINFWLWIALATPSTPHQRCQHHIKGAPLLTADLKGLTTHLALLTPMLMLFSRPPPLCQVLSYQSSRHYHSAVTVVKQGWHEHLPYKPNAFSNSYQQ